MLQYEGGRRRAHCNLQYGARQSEAHIMSGSEISKRSAHSIRNIVTA